jgi:hypothetical protein
MAYYSLGDVFGEIIAGMRDSEPEFVSGETLRLRAAAAGHRLLDDVMRLPPVAHDAGDEAPEEFEPDFDGYEKPVPETPKEPAD